MASEIEIKRKARVPLWIKIFGWIFIVMSVAVPILMIFSSVTGQPGNFYIFGLSYTGSAFHPMALLICTIILFLGVSAFGLLFGKSWGVNACLANGYIGILICVAVMFYTGFSSIRLEPLIQIFYLVKLHKIRKAWVLPE